MVLNFLQRAEAPRWDVLEAPSTVLLLLRQRAERMHLPSFELRESFLYSVADGVLGGQYSSISIVLAFECGLKFILRYFVVIYNCNSTESEPRGGLRVEFTGGVSVIAPGVGKLSQVFYFHDLIHSVYVRQKQRQG